MNTKIQLALFGAGGKMGCRVIDHLARNPGYGLTCVENAERGLANLAERSQKPTPPDQALANADVVILALPDRVLGAVAREVVVQVKPGTLVMTLDPAAAHAGELPARADIGYFVSHPCHPNVFDHFQTDAEINNFFGGTHARQAIVCALMHGTEEHYALGERVARDIYAPVTRSHRITVEQMAILEPAMAETVGICLVMALREALEEAVRRRAGHAAATLTERSATHSTAKQRPRSWPIASTSACSIPFANAPVRGQDRCAPTAASWNAGFRI